MLLLLFLVGLVVTGLGFVNQGPFVVASTPKDGAHDISINISSIAANDLFVPEVIGFKGGVDNSTISSATVKLLRLKDGTATEVPGMVQGTGGGDAISFSPTGMLEPNTEYKFVITDGVKSYNGESFLPFESIFTTGAANKIPPAEPLPVAFTKVAIPGTQNKHYTSLVFGPDGKFYALRLNGMIERFDVNEETGLLENRQTLPALKNAYGARTAIGLTFDPNSTPENLVAWVSHCTSGLNDAPAFDGKISRLSGANLEKEQLVLTNLPRSNKDHLVNSMKFGPDGAIYFCQGSNSSMGAYDGFWQRAESLLSATVLRLDMQKLQQTKLPLDVETTSDQKLINHAPATSMRMADGTYNPYGAEAPLTIYASGVRNAYDLVWHSNGQLYVPANGSAAGGNTPASVKGTRRTDGTFYDGPEVESTSGIQLMMYRGRLRKLIKLFVDPSKSAVQNDWLFRVNPLKSVGYFGHPNPLRGEFVVNRGSVDNPKYPEGTKPDKNFRKAAFNFGLNKSPNGALEYQSDAFGGLLKGRILVCRFSGGSDIIVLEPGAMTKQKQANADSCYDIVKSVSGSGINGIPGFAGFSNPLDIVEDVKTGNLYVSEFNRNNSPTAKAQITLLRVKSIPAEQNQIAATVK
ncbi:Ig-like domain-containing protein [Pontibacter sp. E15-1]|uniref:Ig-like domain-containing protein n=1 Tax=Pontibacter sp. E15-1 TaxID=2919918 RepID=UPI001F50321E|nr:Ig-like domain-containing protein [Pontibacter sp. E15-1]MCJ8164194.1 Ig-like domain-containing protein [Pontibacter sp. E15-1]